MRYRVVNIPLWLGEDESLLARRAAERLQVAPASLREVVVLRRSLDARKKGHPRWLVNVEVTLEQGPARPELPDVSLAPLPEPAPAPVRPPELPPVILGAGPAGLFCAHALLARGVRSIVVDRGKLGTRIHHPAVRQVVELFAHYGGVSRILAEGKPHVGSDLLPGAVSAMRADLERGGCEFHWNARAVDLELREGRVRGLVLADGRTLSCDRLVLAPGNSARELFELFAARGWPIEAKPFAVGFRAEHPQALIDQIQYGPAAGRPGLPPADYKLADNPKVDGQPRGVFSFCMCPGGVVVPTPTESGLQCTNGMSNSHRSSRVANAGVVVAVGPADFEAEGYRGPLAGLAWQRAWEARAYELGGGGYQAPAQRITDYLAVRPGQPPGRSSYPPGLTHADLSTLFPPAVRTALREGLRAFERRMRGYLTDEAVLIGIESRTSSPCR